MRFRCSLSRRVLLALLLWILPTSGWAQATRITSGATLPVSGVAGNVYIKTGTAAGFYYYISGWVGPFVTPFVTPTGSPSSGNLPVFSSATSITNGNLSGDVTTTNTLATTIVTGVVSNAKLATMATASLKGRTTAGTGAVEDLTATQATALLNAMVGDSGAGGTKGLVPAPAAGDAAAGKFLKAGGTWSAPAGAGDVVGPGSASNGHLAVFDGTTGKLIKDGGAVPSGGSRAITFVVDGGGSALTTGIKADVYVPYAATITAVTMLADQSGSVVVDIWKDTYGNYPPTVADTITASAKPTITTAVKSQDNTLTGWTTVITAGDTLRFNIDSATTITKLNLTLTVTP